MLGTELQSHARSAKALNSRTTAPALLSFKKDFSLHLFGGFGKPIPSLVWSKPNTLDGRPVCSRHLQVFTAIALEYISIPGFKLWLLKFPLRSSYSPPRLFKQPSHLPFWVLTPLSSSCSGHTPSQSPRFWLSSLKPSSPYLRYFMQVIPQFRGYSSSPGTMKTTESYWLDNDHKHAYDFQSDADNEEWWQNGHHGTYPSAQDISHLKLNGEHLTATGKKHLTEFNKDKRPTCLTQYLIQQQFSLPTKNNHMNRAKIHCHCLEETSQDWNRATQNGATLKVCWKYTYV